MFAYAILITYRVATRRFSVPLTALTLQFRLLRYAPSSLAVKPPLSLRLCPGFFELILSLLVTTCPTPQ